MRKPKVGDQVRLVTPGNKQLDGSYATVVKLTEWGAHCGATRAATGKFRALWTEMELLPVEYTGDCCVTCGSVRMRQAGACKVCEECGESGGCG